MATRSSIGASVPLSGELAGFGSFVKWGYQHAVDEANAKGGIEVDGKKKKVKLIILDDKTDPNTAASNTTRLITRDKVDAMLGSCTPALVNAGAIVSDRKRSRWSPAAIRSARSRRSRSGPTPGTCSSRSRSCRRCRSRR